jgi:hypothetical protein
MPKAKVTEAQITTPPQGHSSGFLLMEPAGQLWVSTEGASREGAELVAHADPKGKGEPSSVHNRKHFIVLMNLLELRTSIVVHLVQYWVEVGQYTGWRTSFPSLAANV